MAREMTHPDAASNALIELLTDVPHVMFCLKDDAGTYVAVNQAFADRAGRATPAEIVGLRAEQLFPAELAESYERQDQRVLDSGVPMRNELELITRSDGSVGWFVTSKTRLRLASGSLAIASVSVDLRAPAAGSHLHQGVAAALSYAREHAAEAVTVGDVAAASGLTLAQLERAIKRTLGLSVKQVMLRMRLEFALSLLRTSDLAVVAIAARCGYYDQSAFSRQFRRVVGLSPGAYRSEHQGR